MASIIGAGSYLLFRKSIAAEAKKKVALFLMGWSHTQLLTGFLLFMMKLNSVNHTKIGIKILFAVEISLVATMFVRKLKEGKESQALLIIILLSSIATALIAFLWK